MDKSWVPVSKHLEEAERRDEECGLIVERLGLHGFEVTRTRVFRHYRYFHLWYNGMLSTGHLKKVTGIREGLECPVL